MVRGKILVVIGFVAIVTLTSLAQMNERQEGGPPPTVVVVPAQPQPPGGPGPAYQIHADPKPGPLVPGGPGPMPMMRMKELAEQLRARAREAQELSDRLRRQADELDQMAMRQMNRGQGPQGMDQMPRELAEIKEAIGRAEREGRQQEAAELRQRADELKGRFRPMSPDERQEMIKRQVERLRDEAKRAKEQGRMDESERIWKEADRMEQQLREQGPREKGEFGQPMPPEVQDILRSAEQAEREGRMDDARRQREKAEIVARQFEEQKRQGFKQQGPREDERQGMKRKIEQLRNEAQRAKEQNRFEDADRMWKEADRLEQQLREQGPRDKGDRGKPMPPEVQDILRSAEQAEREGRMDDARRQREKAEMVARQFQEQKGQGPKPPGSQLKDELIRSMEQIKQEIGRLWQAVNEMRNRPKDGRPT